jgi:hypothetical protein
MENAENENVERVRASLLGFAALTQASIEEFRLDSFSPRELKRLEGTVDDIIATMGGSDFRTIHQWVKERYSGHASF